MLTTNTIIAQRKLSTNASRASADTATGATTVGESDVVITDSQVGTGRGHAITRIAVYDTSPDKRAYDAVPEDIWRLISPAPADFERMPQETPETFRRLLVFSIQGNGVME